MEPKYVKAWTGEPRGNDKRRIVYASTSDGKIIDLTNDREVRNRETIENIFEDLL